MSDNKYIKAVEEANKIEKEKLNHNIQVKFHKFDKYKKDQFFLKAHS